MQALYVVTLHLGSNALSHQFLFNPEEEAYEPCSSPVPPLQASLSPHGTQLPSEPPSCTSRRLPTSPPHSLNSKHLTFIPRVSLHSKEDGSNRERLQASSSCDRSRLSPCQRRYLCGQLCPNSQGWWPTDDWVRLSHTPFTMLQLSSAHLCIQSCSLPAEYLLPVYPQINPTVPGAPYHRCPTDLQRPQEVEGRVYPCPIFSHTVSMSVFAHQYTWCVSVTAAAFRTQ